MSWKETARFKTFYDDSTRAIARVEVDVSDSRIICIELTTGGQEVVITEKVKLLLEALEKKLEEQGYRW